MVLIRLNINSDDSVPVVSCIVVYLIVTLLVWYDRCLSLHYFIKFTTLYLFVLNHDLAKVNVLTIVSKFILLSTVHNISFRSILRLTTPVAQGDSTTALEGTHRKGNSGTGNAPRLWSWILPAQTQRSLLDYNIVREDMQRYKTDCCTPMYPPSPVVEHLTTPEIQALNDVFSRLERFDREEAERIRYSLLCNVV